MDDLDSTLRRLADAPSDQAAWQRFVLLTWPFVRTLCSRWTKSLPRHLDPEDLAQDVYLKFARYWAELAASPSPPTGEQTRALLVVIARRTARDAARFWHKPRRDVGREADFPIDQVPQLQPTPAEEAEWQDFLEHLCQRFSLEERQILTLRLQGYSMKEIAERLGRPQRTVERRFSDLRRSLPDELLDEDERPNPREKMPGCGARE